MPHWTKQAGPLLSGFERQRQKQQERPKSANECHVSLKSQSKSTDRVILDDDSKKPLQRSFHDNVHAAPSSTDASIRNGAANPLMQLSHPKSEAVKEASTMSSQLADHCINSANTDSEGRETCSSDRFPPLVPPFVDTVQAHRPAPVTDPVTSASQHTSSMLMPGGQGKPSRVCYIVELTCGTILLTYHYFHTSASFPVSAGAPPYHYPISAMAPPSLRKRLPAQSGPHLFHMQSLFQPPPGHPVPDASHSHVRTEPFTSGLTRSMPVVRSLLARKVFRKEGNKPPFSPSMPVHLVPHCGSFSPYPIPVSSSPVSANRRGRTKNEEKEKAEPPFQIAYAAPARNGERVLTDVNGFGYEESEHEGEEGEKKTANWSTMHPGKPQRRQCLPSSFILHKANTPTNTDRETIPSAYKKFQPVFKPKILRSDVEFKLPILPQPVKFKKSRPQSTDVTNQTERKHALAETKRLTLFQPPTLLEFREEQRKSAQKRAMTVTAITNSEHGTVSGGNAVSETLPYEQLRNTTADLMSAKVKFALLMKNCDSDFKTH